MIGRFFFCAGTRGAEMPPVRKDGTVMRKWELSLMIGIAAALVWCAVSPAFVTNWWTAAFEPLCDELLRAEADGGSVVFRSKLWDLAGQFVF